MERQRDEIILFKLPWTIKKTLIKINTLPTAW